MPKCDVCGKGPQFGNKISHSHRVTKRMWHPNIQKIKVNLEKTENSQNAIVYKIDFLSGLKLLAKKNYLLDYIFLDPPYNKGLVNISLLEISKLSILKKNGLLIAQHYKKEKVMENLNNLKLFNQRRYGECYLSFYEYVNI
ncbi:unnamed protein product [marine sediment metagenome]|uniref:50S ribosomal protein L28 n=1 Tax=marine sediment metagenome TaxID=412755 RepID=X1F3C8_9ZZZZ